MGQSLFTHTETAQEQQSRELLEQGIQVFAESYAANPSEVGSMQQWLALWSSLDGGIEFCLRGIASQTIQSNLQRSISELATRIGMDVFLMAEAHFRKENRKGTLGNKLGKPIETLREWHGSGLPSWAKSDRLKDLARASLEVTKESELPNLGKPCEFILHDLRARRWANIRSLGKGRSYDAPSVQWDLYTALFQIEQTFWESDRNDDTTSAHYAALHEQVQISREQLISYWQGRLKLEKYLKTLANLSGPLYVATAWSVHNDLDQLPTDRVIGLLRADATVFEEDANTIMQELTAAAQKRFQEL